jgi:hypothetical protein
VASHRRILVAAGAALALLVAYLALWAGVSRIDIGRSDFTSSYVAATLLREGHRGDLYDEAVQQPLHARLIAPDQEGNLPFVNPPPAAALAAPVTVLGLDAAYRLWSLLQLGLLAAAVAIAIRAAPWPARRPAWALPASALLALAGLGTASTLLLGQWDGLSALGLALAYASWRRGRPAHAGAWLALSTAVAKPHLALGLLVYAAARRDRRLLLGMVAGLAGALAASLALVGPSGLEGFAHATAAGVSRWPAAGMLGLTGLFGSWLGDGAATKVLSAVAAAAALAGSAVLGDVGRRQPDRLEITLGGATALSLLASPHLLGQDLALLAPAVAWCLGRAAVCDRRPPQPWPGRASRRVLLLWAAINIAAAVDLGRGSTGPPGRLVPWALLAAGVAALQATENRRVIRLRVRTWRRPWMRRRPVAIARSTARPDASR